jgi:hypothetical protein
VPVALTFPEVSKVTVFNHVAPRLGASYDIFGDGKTVLKGNYGRYYFNPGVGLADSVNPNTANQYADFVWNDLNNDRVFQAGEQGVLQTRLHGRGLGVCGARVDERPGHPHWLRLEEGQERLAAGEHAPSARRLQRPGHHHRSGT